MDRITDQNITNMIASMSLTDEGRNILINSVQDMLNTMLILDERDVWMISMISRISCLIGVKGTDQERNRLVDILSDGIVRAELGVKSVIYI